MLVSSRHHAEVTVVGGGPVGMLTGLALARRGVEVVILEAGPDEVRSQWRGSTLHPPTVEILAELGLVEPVLAGAVRVDRLTYADLELPDIAEFDYGLLEGRTPYPFRLQYEQYKLVRQLRAALADEASVDLRFAARVTGLAQDEGGVTLTVEPADRAAETVRTRWVVAADGAHSTVRHLLGVGFPGFTYEFQSLVAATPFPFEEHLSGLGPVGYWSGPRGRFSLIRTPDVWRTALTTGTRSDDEVDVTEGALHPDFVADVALLLGDEVDPRTVPLRQHQLYRSHQKVAAAFRDRHVVLVGDAAHLSSTTGGMGLNSGIHDGWALAPALAEADDGALDAWARRRRDVAVAAVQPATRANREGADASSRTTRRARLERLVRDAADPAVARAHLEAASMLAIAH